MRKDLRIDYLDSVRGLAAFSVLMYHVIYSRWGELIYTKLGGILFNGASAVNMFFVLSGFVLSWKYFQTNTEITPRFYKQYVISRIFRLYPAFIVMLFVYYIYKHWPELSALFWWETVVKNPHYFWEEAALIRGHHDLFFPDWTLGIEVAVSVFVPFLILLARYDARLLVYFMAAVFFIGREYINDNFLGFGIGVLLAFNFDRIQVFDGENRPWYRYRRLLILPVIAFYSLYQIFRLSPPGPTFTYFTNNFIHFNEAFVSTIGAGVFLLYILHSKRLQGILSIKPLVFLGKISYGLYLSHWFFIPLFNTYADRILEWLGQSQLKYFFLLSGFTITASALTGVFLYYVVERPFIRLGKKLAAKVN